LCSKLRTLIGDKFGGDAMQVEDFIVMDVGDALCGDVKGRES
jgi:hypothetical protein